MGRVVMVDRYKSQWYNNRSMDLMKKVLMLSLILLVVACATAQQEQQAEYVEGYVEACKQYPQMQICAPAQKLDWYLNQPEKQKEEQPQ